LHRRPPAAVMEQAGEATRAFRITGFELPLVACLLGLGLSARSAWL
jgi:hypothetical protein